jgi:hypothetical protein
LGCPHFLTTSYTNSGLESQNRKGGSEAAFWRVLIMRHANSSACLVIALKLHALKKSHYNSEAAHRKGEPEPKADFRNLLQFGFTKVYKSKD